MMALFCVIVDGNWKFHDDDNKAFFAMFCLVENRPSTITRQFLHS